MPEPITINGRKALLIGLGSTGAMVCNQILEKIVWTHGSPDNVPWIRTVVLETAHLAPESLASRYAKCVHLKIDVNDYANLITNPQNYKQSIDFPSWDIPEITGTHTAIANGASNIRIMGRLALLFNYETVKKVISDEVDKLVSLSSQQASVEFSKESDVPVNVAFSNDTVYVYVVGTLCGGTASGSFIDLGYFLRSRPGYNLESTGIFLLPSQQERNQLYSINAYSALVELNHFSDDRVRYKVQYPDSPGQPWEGMPGMTPFGHTYLVQSRGADPSEYSRLVTSTADYVYTDLIGSSGIPRDNKRDNIATFFIQRDLWGATQKFFTFGLGVVEFPFAKVYKACTLRLAKRGYQLLAGSDSDRLTETQTKLRLGNVPITNKDNSIRQLTMLGDATLADRIARKLRELQSKSIGSPELATIVREQIDAAFDGGLADVFPDLPSRIVPQTVEENSQHLRSLTRQKVRDEVTLFLSKHDCFGIKNLLMFLDALEKRIKSLRDELDDSSLAAVISGLNDQANTAYEQLLECHQDWWLKRVGQSRRAKERYAGELIQILTDYYEQRLRQCCSEALCIICEDTLATVASIRKRLEDSASGMIAEVTSIIHGMDDLYKKTDVPSGSAQDGWTRSINGTELFEPGETVIREYNDCLIAEKDIRGFAGRPEDLESILARECVQGYVEKALERLLMDPSKIGYFDTARDIQDISDDQLLEYAKPARSAFRELKKHNIIQRILARPDCASIMQGAQEKSALFLGLNLSHPRHQDHPNKHYGFVFYDHQDAKSREFAQELESAKVIGGDVEALNVVEPNQVLILRERGAFPLGIVQMLIDEQPSEWRNAYQNAQEKSCCHSRGDIDEWITWSRDIEEERTGTKNLFLVAVALDIVKFNGARDYRFEYQPMSPADPGFVQFSNNLDDVASLMRSKGVEALVYQKIKEFRDLHDPVVEMDKLITFIKGADNRFVEGDVSLSRQNIEDSLLDYIFGDEALLRAYQSIYKDPWELSLLRIDEDGRSAYHCPHCNGKLGYTTSSLYIMDNSGGRAKKVKQCAYCKKSLERPMIGGPRPES